MGIKVYISSTYEDLKDFRAAVFECVDALKEYYDGNGMEKYSAEGIHFVKKCEDDVAACDVYILILGRRYGYMPQGFPKSITEVEYDKAIACQQSGAKPEILVFKAGDFCKQYNYEEKKSSFIEYEESFLNKVNEYLSPKPFESIAELKFLVANALMKRLFRLIRSGEKIILPDKDSLLCYCDRRPVMTSLQISILLKKKRIFFVQGNETKDYPKGIVKRFAKFSLESSNKIDPILYVSDLFTTTDPENLTATAIYNILDYMNRAKTAENLGMKGFINEFAFLKSPKVILPFCYTSVFDEDYKKFTDFLSFLDTLFNEYAKEKREFELYIILLVYSEQPDYDAIKLYIEKYDQLKMLATTIDKPSPVFRKDILSWLETFVTEGDFSLDIYEAYFDKEENKQYDMREVNKKLATIIDDIGKGDEKIKNFI